MAKKKSGGKAPTYTKQDLSFDFGANKKSSGKKGGKRKPAGGGSVQ